MRGLLKGLFGAGRRVESWPVDDSGLDGLALDDLPRVAGVVCEVCDSQRVGLVEVRRGPGGVVLWLVGCVDCGCAWTVEVVE